MSTTMLLEESTILFSYCITEGLVSPSCSCSALWHSSWSTAAPFTQTLSGLLRLKVHLFCSNFWLLYMFVCVCTQCICECAVCTYVTYNTANLPCMHSHAVPFSLLQRGDYVSVILFNLTEQAVDVNGMSLSGYRVA